MNLINNSTSINNNNPDYSALKLTKISIKVIANSFKFSTSPKTIQNK